MIGKGHLIKGSKALILGFTFKENCPDTRNTRVIDIYQELLQFGLDVDIYDPWADPQDVQHEYNVPIIDRLNGTDYKAIIVAVSHNEFLSIDFQTYKDKGAVIFDTKSFIDRNIVDGRL